MLYFNMEYESVNLDKFYIAGISVRTNNLNSKSKEDISKLWDEWFADGISDLINNKLSNNIYCAYTEYESDFNGDYTVIIGCTVKDFDGLPSELIKLEINHISYRKYDSFGKIPDIVLNNWEKIWQSKDIIRAYKTDFDVYIGNDMENMEVITYVSVK